MACLHSPGCAVVGKSAIFSSEFSGVHFSVLYPYAFEVSQEQTVALTVQTMDSPMIGVTEILELNRECRRYKRPCTTLTNWREGETEAVCWLHQKWDLIIHITCRGGTTPRLSRLVLWWRWLLIKATKNERTFIWLWWAIPSIAKKEESQNAASKGVERRKMSASANGQVSSLS